MRATQTNIFDALQQDEPDGWARPFSTRELRAIQNAMKTYKYRIQLCRWPIVDFISIGTGNPISLHISALLAAYNEELRSRYKERNRVSRERKL